MGLWIPKLHAQNLTIETNTGKLSFCSGGGVTLQVKTGYGKTIDGYYWQQSASGTWNTLGTAVNYTVQSDADYRLVVKTGNTFDTSNVVSITMNNNPSINAFTFTNNNACANVGLSFTDKNPNMSYSWNFGDGSSISTVQNPNHTFPQVTGNGSNNYTVVETVTDGNGCQASVSDIVTIKQLPNPKLLDSIADADFRSPFSNCSSTSSNEIYKLFVKNESTPISDILKYQLDWGDGSPIVSMNSFNTVLNHTYLLSGIYPLRLTVENKNKCSSQFTANIINQTNPAIGLQGPPSGSTQGCTPQGWWFKCTNYQSNSLGTKYKWDFDDGDTVIWDSPLIVDSIFHVFKSSSCNNNNNQFTVTLTATNGCTSTPATISAIKLFKKPVSNFTVNSNPACINNNIVFKNNSILAYNSDKCDRQTRFIWDFGDNSPLVESGSTTTTFDASHQYSSTGLYTAKLFARGACGTDTFSMPICVNNAPPVPSFSVSSTSGCVPFSINLSNTTASGTCPPSGLTWGITKSNLICGKDSSNDFTFISNTSTNSNNATVRFNNQGTYNIELSINACGGPQKSIIKTSITANRKPQVESISVANNVCTGVNIAPSASVSACGGTNLAYNWSFQGGTPASSTSSSPNVIFNTAGISNITLNASNKECGTTTVEKQITVANAPTANAINNITVCSGALVTIPAFTGSVTGTVYNWTNSNRNIGLNRSSGSSNISNFTATNTSTIPIVATITVTPSLSGGGCSGTPITFTITVNPKPASPTVTTPINLCQGVATNALTATVASGNTLNWYNTADGSVTPTAPTPNTTNVGSGNYYVSQVNSFGCESNRATITYSVSASPIITANANNPTKCQTANGTVEIKGLSNGANYSLSYTKDGIAQATRTFTASNNSYTISGLASGIYDNIKVKLGNCESNAVGPLSLSDPNPPATPSVTANPAVLCSGGTLTLNASSTTAGVTYTWSGPNNFSSSLANPTISNIPLTGNGVYSVTATLAGCTSAAGTVNVTVNETPANVQITGTNICSGNTLNLSATTTTTGAVSYLWTGPNSFSSNNQNMAITNAATNASGNYNVTATLGSCTASASKSIIVDSTPKITSDSIAIPTNCGTATGKILLKGLKPNTQYKANYNGNLGTTVLQTDASGTFTISGLPAGSYSQVSVTSVSGNCTSNEVGPFTLVDPTPPPTPTITAINKICSGGNWQLNGNSSIADVQYIWTGPNNYRNNTQNPIINRIATSASGTYTLNTVQNGCKSGDATVTVAVDSTPVKPDIDPVLPMCEGGTLSLNAKSSDGLSSLTYTWTGPNAYSSALKNMKINPVAAKDSGLYMVYATNTSGNCTSDTTSVRVTVRPAMTKAAIDGNKEVVVCNFTPTSNQTQTIKGNLDATRPYEIGLWKMVKSPIGSAPNIANPANQQTSITFDKSGDYLVEWSIRNGVCEPSKDTITFHVNDKPNIVQELVGNTNVCASNNVAISINPTSIFGAIRNWQIKRPYTSNTWIDTAVQSPSIVFNNVQDSFSVQLVVVAKDTLNCGSSPIYKDITINVAPASSPGIAIGDTTVCFGVNSGKVSLSGNVGSPIWQSSTDNIRFTNISGSVEQQYVYNNLAQTTWYRSAVKSGTCDTVFSNAVKVVVYASISNNTISGKTDVCINTPIGLLTGSEPTGANGNFVYQWQQTTDTSKTASWTDISGATSKDYSALTITQDIYYRRLATTQLCAGSQSNISPVFAITMRPDAVANWIIVKDTACAPFSIDNTVLSPKLNAATNSNYHWYAHDSLYGSDPLMNPGYRLIATGDSVLIKMVAVSKYGCKNDTVTHQFFTYPKPDAGFTLSTTEGCGPLSVTINNTTKLINRFNYVWDFGFGTPKTTVAQPGTIVFPPNPLNKDTVYTVTLTAFTPCDTVIISKTIKVRAKPKAIFTPAKTFGCSPFTNTFINTSRGDSITYVWNWGDATGVLPVNDSLPVQHTYHTGIQDTFHVQLIAANYCGSDTAGYKIVVAKSTIDLRVVVNGNELTNCRNSVVHFINTTKGASAFVWDFGDGNKATTFGKKGNLDTVIHRYDSVGNFAVKVRATNNCTDTTGSLNIKVLSTPTAAFVATPDTACIGHPIAFKNNSDATTGLVWRFGDGNSSLLRNPPYAYTNAGNYTVQLIAERQHPSANICRDTAIRQVTILSSLPGSIKVSDSISQCVPFTVTFSNGYASSSKLCTWNFGDGTVGTGNTITHTFTTVRSYNVSMNAVDSGGCTYVANQKIVVNGPVGSFVYDHGIICGKTPVRFEASVTGTDSLLWDFGNGQKRFTTDRIVYYNYLQSGKFVPNVTLLSGKNANCKVPLMGIDTITMDHVKAGFSVNEKKVCDATTVNFVDTSRAYLGIKNWSWNFGDSKSSIQKNPTHVYTTTNTWAINLMVTSKSGCSDTLNLPTYIKVNNTPQIAIDPVPLGCANQPVVYNAIVTSIDSAAYFDWKFSNGNAGNTPTSINYYSLAGTYSAQLIVGTAFGCYDTAKTTTKVNPTPVVTTNPNFKLCKGGSAFINTSGAASYQWMPSAGLSCNTCANPIAKPTTTTEYVVAGYNSYGCAGRDTLLITVIQPFKLTTSGNDTMCIGDAPKQLQAFNAFKYRWQPSTGLDNANIATPKAQPLLTTHYQVIGDDGENCFSDTATLVVAVGNFPQIKLPNNTVVATGQQVDVTPKIVFPVATAGPIAQYHWTPNTNLSCLDCPSPMATVKKDVCYTLNVENIYGCKSNTDTMCIKAFCESAQVYFPNGFTPDGDGHNDVFMVRASGIKSVKHFKIFNRWGQVVFERANILPNDPSQGWNGQVNGKAQPSDVYVYICEVVCDNDASYTYKGNIAIIK